MNLNKYFEYLRYDLWRVMRPLAYHGAGKSGPYFEGWYFKLVSADGGDRLSIIPGVYIGNNHQEDHAFIQLIDGISGHSDFYPFPIEAFSFQKGAMDIRVGKSHFTKNHISLDLDQQGIDIKGRVEFHHQQLWPVTIFSPGVMGWYAWVPGMECYHGIVSMDHSLHGQLKLNGKTHDFSSGRGYMEKDWGQAMPSAWIWMQSNHFEQRGVSFTFSIANIPWGKLHFTGFLGGFLYKEKLYRFATYTGAKVSGLEVNDKHVSFSVGDGRHHLTVSAERRKGSTLQAPTIRQMDRRIMETLSARITVTFSERKNGRWIDRFSGTGEHAGLELVGDLSVLK